jgi:dimethyl sulfoxide reductase membrane subunit
MAIVSLPVAVLVHSVTAWIFGFLVARPFWNTAILAPLFISSALVSGTALVLLVAWTVRG